MENNKATKETQKVCTERYITLKGITLIKLLFVIKLTDFTI